MEYFLIHEARYKRILREIDALRRTQSQNPQKLRILDVGCFPFDLGAALKKLGHEVWGISSPHEPLKQKNVSIVNIETDPFPYKNNMFDLVICSEVLEHLTQSPMPALKEMCRVAKPGGHVLITTPNINGSIHVILRLLGRETLPAEGNKNVYHHHNHEYTLSELAKTITTAGWTVKRAVYFIGYPPFRRRNRHDNPLFWTSKFINYVVMLAFARLRDTLLVIGQK